MDHTLSLSPGTLKYHKTKHHIKRTAAFKHFEKVASKLVRDSLPDAPTRQQLIQSYYKLAQKNVYTVAPMATRLAGRFVRALQELPDCEFGLEHIYARNNVRRFDPPHLNEEEAGRGCS